MSLRDRQKADRQRRILAAAVALFGERGYRAARLEDLAERADVSVGTVYNYYRTKGDILIATVAMEVEEVVATGEAIVADPPRGVDRALLVLVHHYYDHSLKYLSKEMWRSAMALSIEAPDTPNGRRYTALDNMLRAQVTRLIEHLQSRGEVRPGIAAAPLGELVFNALNMLFIEFVKDDTMAVGTLRDTIAAQIRPLAHMISTEAA